MQIRLSKTLRKHLDAGGSEAKRSGNVSLTADIALLSIIKEGMSHAGHILRKLLKDWEIYQLRIKIEHEAAQKAGKKQEKKDGPDIAGADEKLMSAIIEGVTEVALSSSPAFEKATEQDMQRYAVANSGHFLIWALSNDELVSSRILELYGVTVEKVYDYLCQMPVEEDYYRDLEILGRLSNPNIIEIRPVAGSRQEEEENEGFDASAAGNRISGSATATKSRSRAKSMLEQFGTNLSAVAAKGEIDPVIGRDKEIERLIQILGRRKKNNPILIGEAGVGKSAIVEGLALRIESGDIPSSLAGKEVFSLDMALLVAGTKYRGEFEQRIKGLISELRSNKNLILFIDEIHTITGAGSTQGSLDTANILKPSLARGEIQCIGATTLDEYRENIETDSALERRFQKIIVEPTTKEQTLEILCNIKGHYERHHGVRYTDEALRACVDLAERYITDRNFPDKAIDILDEAGSKARFLGAQEPAMIKELETALAEIEMSNARPVSKLAHETEAEKRTRIFSLRSRINECRAEWYRELSMNPFILGTEHIGEIITSMTGIPVEKVSKGEKDRLAKMEEYLSSKVIGQPDAVGKITKSIQRSRTGLKDPNKPIGVFMFVGPTGVGKTHLANELSKWMFDKGDSLIRIDMSEYSEKHNVSRMIGSPPGYVGYNEGGQLTEAVRRRPYAVILFDEIEKAHPDVFNIMLQIFDDGQLTDGNGRKVDFRNTIIIMTSNVGSKAIAQKPNAVGYMTGNREHIETVNKDSAYRAALESTFAPEFINRIDDIVIFNTLTLNDVQKIVELELGVLKARAESLHYGLNVTPCARRRIGELGYNSRYGVRSLKRTILDLVEEPIAHLIVSGRIDRGDTIRVECRGKSIEVLRQQPAMKKSS